MRLNRVAGYAHGDRSIVGSFTNTRRGIVVLHGAAAVGNNIGGYYGHYILLISIYLDSKQKSGTVAPRIIVAATLAVAYCLHLSTNCGNSQIRPVYHLRLDCITIITAHPICTLRLRIPRLRHIEIDAIKWVHPLNLNGVITAEHTAPA